MRLITTNTALESNLLRCVRRYDNIAFAAAWASADTSVFRLLCSRRDAIRQAVIGTHFYQTHPDVLDEFTEDESIRFMLQPSGTFHPKIFIFWNATHWEGIVGSANLTKGALGSNSEAVLLASQADAGCSSLKDNLMELIDSYWHQAEAASPASAKAYREIWKLRQPVLQPCLDSTGKGDEESARTFADDVDVMAHVL